MADRLTVKLVGSAALEKRIKELSPKQNRDIVEPALLESMLLSLRISAREKIGAGGKGAAKAKKLTSRTGSLRGSLESDFAIDRAGLSRGFVEGGTNLVYGSVHETGGTFAVPAHSRANRVNPGRHDVKAHTITFPPRPFLAPGLEDAPRQFESIFEKHWRRAGDL